MTVYGSSLLLFNISAVSWELMSAILYTDELSAYSKTHNLESQRLNFGMTVPREASFTTAIKLCLPAVA
jgi:hypothetical protein